jgi:hypothetical protein
MAGDANLRRYVGNDAANATDPSGLESVSDAAHNVIREAGIPVDGNAGDNLTILIKKFRTLAIKAAPNQPLHYWNTPVIDSKNKEPKTLCDTGNGTCVAWSRFFIEVARYAKITLSKDISMAAVVISPAPDPGPGVTRTLMVGADWTIRDKALSTVTEFSTDTDPDEVIENVKKGDNASSRLIEVLNKSKNISNVKPMKAQNTDNPKTAVFTEHVVVLIKQGNQVFLFDPSYGIKSDEYTTTNKVLNDSMLKDEGVQKALSDYRKKAFGGILKLTYNEKEQSTELRARRLAETDKLNLAYLR